MNSDNTHATFDRTSQFGDPLNNAVLEVIRDFEQQIDSTIEVVTPYTEPILRPSGSIVLDNSQPLLAAWPDLRLQSKFNSDLTPKSIQQSGINLGRPVSGITIIFKDKGHEEPWGVRNVLVYTAERLKQELYLRKLPNGMLQVINGLEAFGLTEDDIAIVPGWSYIDPTKRLSKTLVSMDPDVYVGGNPEGGRRLKELFGATTVMVKEIDSQLKLKGKNPVIISQQDGIYQFLNGEAPLMEFKEGDLIDPSQIVTHVIPEILHRLGKTDPSQLNNLIEKGLIKPNANEKGSYTVCLADVIDVGSPEAGATGSNALRSEMQLVEGIYHAIDGYGPVYFGTNPQAYGGRIGAKV